MIAENNLSYISKGENPFDIFKFVLIEIEIDSKINGNGDIYKILLTLIFRGLYFKPSNQSPESLSNNYCIGIPTSESSKPNSSKHHSHGVAYNQGGKN